MKFIQNVIFKPASLTWVVVTGLSSLVGIFGLPESVGLAERILGVLAVTFGTAFLLLLWYAWRIFQEIRAPVRVRQIVKGSHHYRGTLVVILDKENWVVSEQVLVLVELANDVQSPLAILRIETFTTKGFPQAIVLRSLTDKNLPEHLADASRWDSMLALSEIKYRYLQDGSDA